MPRNGSGVFSLVSTYEAISGEVIEAQQHNDPLEDLEQDANAARPIVAGGTGATTAAGARTELFGVSTTVDNTVARYNGTTGALQASTAIIDDSGNQTLVSTDAGATAGPVQTIYRDSATPAAGDLIGQIAFDGEDSAGNQETYARIQAEIVSPTSTTEAARLFIQRKVAGAFVSEYLDSQHVLSQGRLTLSTGVAVTTSDVTAASTIYFTPFRGNRIWLYVSSVWTPFIFTELSLALSGGTASRPHDVFVYSNSGTPTLEILAWTNATTRATGLTTQDGIYVKSGDATRRYLGTIYLDGSKQCEDSLAKRLVWNMNNRVLRPMRVLETTSSWTYNTASWQQMNGNTANQLAMVRGLDEDSVRAIATANVVGSIASPRAVYCGIGLDTASTTASGTLYNRRSAIDTLFTTLMANYEGFPGLGYHYLTWLQQAAGADTQTWYGTSQGQTGIFGEVMA